MKNKPNNAIGCTTVDPIEVNEHMNIRFYKKN